MTVTSNATQDAQRAARATAAAVGWGADPPTTARRSRGRLLAAAVLVLAGGWLGAALVASSGSRLDVVALARPVERFAVLERADLETVRMSADGVPTLPAADIDELVGRVAASDLVPGTLLASAQLMADDQRLVGAAEAVVGALVAPGDAPASLAVGAEVLVIVRPPTAAQGEAEAVPGWVRAVGRAGAAGDRPVSVVVPQASAAPVSAAAAERRVSIVELGS